MPRRRKFTKAERVRHRREAAEGKRRVLSAPGWMGDIARRIHAFKERVRLRRRIAKYRSKR